MAKLKAYYYRTPTTEFDGAFFIANLHKYEGVETVKKIGLCRNPSDKEFKRRVSNLSSKLIRQKALDWEVKGNGLRINRIKAIKNKRYDGE